jgi:hypothetical protein
MISTLAAAAGSIEAFGMKWSVPYGKEWSFQNGVLTMLAARPQESPRFPVQYALLSDKSYEQVTIECEVKREGGSVILVYAWRDATHFNYAHLSVDSPEKQIVHNGIFHVYGGERVRISKGTGAGSLPTREWTKVKLDYDAKTGRVDVLVDGKAYPSLVGVDLSLGAGKVGMGSFFETGEFRNVKITGK